MKLLPILLLSCTLFAKGYEIYIAKSAHKNRIIEAKNRMRALHIRTSIIKKRGGYLLLSGGYADKRVAMQVLRRVRTHYPKARLHYVSALFVSASFGYSLALAEGKDIDIGDMRDGDFSYMLSIGYYLRENLFIKASLFDNSTDDYASYNLCGSIDYAYRVSAPFELYGGGVVGMGMLEMKGLNDTSASSSLLFGFEAGAKYDVTTDIAIDIRYLGLFGDHFIDIDNGASSISFSYFNGAYIGIEYTF